MKKIIKSLSIFVIAFLTVLVFAGCGKSTTKRPQTTTPSPTTKSNATTKENKKFYSISLEGSITGVTCHVRTMPVIDGVPTPTDVDFTKTYEQGTILYVQVLNDSESQVKISATIGTTVRNEYIAAGEAGGFMGLELTGNLALKLEEAADVQIANVTINKDTSADQAGICYNSLHFYATSDRDNELVNGSEVSYGTEVEAFCWNAASKVNFKIMNGSTTVVDKVYDKLTDDQMGPGGMGHNEKFKFTVSGDVTIAMTVVQEVGTKTVTIRKSDTNVNFSIYYFDENNQKQTFYSTTSLPIGTEIFASVTAPYDYDPIVAFAYDEDNEAYIQKITCVSGGYEQDIKGTFEAITVTSDIIFDFVNDANYTLTFSSNVDGADFVIFDVTEVEDPVMITESGKSFPVLTQLGFSVANFAENEAKVIVNIYSREGYSAPMTLMGSLVIDYGNYIFPEIVTLESDIKVEIVEYAEYTVTIDEVTETGVNATFVTVDMETEQPAAITNGTYAKNTMIFAYVANTSSKTVIVKFLDDSEAVLASFEVEPNDMNGLEDTFFLTCNIHIVFEYGEETNYTITFDNSYSTDITIEGYYFASGSSTPGNISSGDALPANTFLSFRALNTSTNENYVIKAMNGTTLIDSSEITAYDPVEDTYGVGGIMFNLTSNVTIVISLNQATVAYTITYDNNYDSDITLTGAIISQDGYPTFNSGDSIEENSGIAVQARNASTTTKYIVKAMCGTEVLDSYTIDVSDGTNPGVGGVMFTLTGNVTIVVSIYEEATTYTVTINNPYDDITLMVYNELDSVNSGDEIEAGTELAIYAMNPTDSANYVIKLMSGTTVLDSSNITAADGDDLGGGMLFFTLNSNVTIVISYEEAGTTTYTITFNNERPGDMRIEVIYDDENGETIIYKDETDLVLPENTDVVINIYNDNIAEDAYARIVGSSLNLFSYIPLNNFWGKRFDLTGDVTVTADAEVATTYTVSIENEFEDSITLKVYYLINGEVEIEIHDGDEIAENTTIYAEATNTSEYSDFVLRAEGLFDIVTSDSISSYDEDEMAPGFGEISFTLTINITIYIYDDDFLLDSYQLVNDITADGITITAEAEGEEYNFGDYLEEDTTITVTIVNDNEDPCTIIVYRYLDDQRLDYVVIYEGDNRSIYITLDCDMYLDYYDGVLELDTYTIEFDVDSDILDVDLTVDGSYCPLDTEIEEEANVVVIVENLTDYDYHVVLFYADSEETYLEKIIMAHKSYEFDFYMYDNLVFGYEISTVTKYLIGIETEFDLDDLDYQINDTDYDYYDDNDYVLDDTVLTFTMWNDSIDTIYKVTVLDSEDQVIGLAYIYPGDGESSYGGSSSFTVHSEIIITIEEVTLDTYTLHIDDAFNGSIYRGSIVLIEGDTLYAGERLYIEYECAEDETLTIDANDGENVIEITDYENESFNSFTFDEENHYCFIYNVSSDIYINVR